MAMASMGIAMIMIIITWQLDSSRLGLQLLTIREDETAAKALGIRTTQLKVGTFAALSLCEFKSKRR